MGNTPIDTLEWAKDCIAYDQFYDLKRLKQLLKKDPSLALKPTRNSYTLLQNAILYEKKDAVVLLLKYKNKLELRTKFGPFGETALDIAARKGHLDIVELLLAHRAKINPNSGNVVTPLHAAAAGGHLKIVKLLLAKKAQVNAHNGVGQTPLHGAAYNGRLEIVKLLLAHGATACINEQDEYGSTPLSWAVLANRGEVAKLLRKHGGKILKKKVTLHDAARDGNVRKVKELLKTNPEHALCKDKCGKTPLHHAAHQGHKTVVKLMLSHKVNVNERDQNNETPLYTVADSNDEKTRDVRIEIAELLLKHGADANVAENFFGLTPLHRAVAFGQEDMVGLLINHNADVNVLDKKGRKAMDFARHSTHIMMH